MENIFMRFLLVWRSSFITMWVVTVNHKLIIFEPKLKPLSFSGSFRERKGLEDPQSYK